MGGQLRVRRRDPRGAMAGATRCPAGGLPRSRRVGKWGTASQPPGWGAVRADRDRADGEVLPLTSPRECADAQQVVALGRSKPDSWSGAGERGESSPSTGQPFEPGTAAGHWRYCASAGAGFLAARWGPRPERPWSCARVSCLLPSAFSSRFVAFRWV